MDVVMRMPDVATVDDTVTLLRWLVEVGQPIRRGEPLLEVETDKAILEVESSVSGTLHSIKVVAVSDAYDAKGVLKSAVRDDNPVLIFEHKLLYGSKGARTEPGAVDATSDVPDGDYTVPLDRAAVRRRGRDVTILAWLLMAHFARQAADRLAAEGIDAEVIDVRSLSPLDFETIGESVQKTGRVVIVEEGPRTGGVGAEIAAGIMERSGADLLAPVVRVASADVPVPFTPVLEDADRPDVTRIIEAARAVIRA